MTFEFIVGETVFTHPKDIICSTTNQLHHHLHSNGSGNPRFARK
jgi:hypothetical protein